MQRTLRIGTTTLERCVDVASLLAATPRDVCTKSKQVCKYVSKTFTKRRNQLSANETEAPSEPLLLQPT